ncbi:type II and III secretion system protein family protein [Sabulicella glaciei]|uniref:Type II and III secretion system protein family protein n=1 Tax=Sabulicella glaciei TaxID=2984948 RepID=A0ABT3NR20_9PROT|nr:type II and III secretion system protein family protein [Roseococcus sp. MDT2-1-1]MCW8084323.1 type II and III secretion system protein family protein [Roseococcus sp. MDT2-1-1]
MMRPAILAGLLGIAGPVLAQAPAPALQPTPLVPSSSLAPAAPVSLRLEAGMGRMLTLPAPAATVLAADPRVARVQAASPTSLFLMAVGNGRTTLIATDANGSPVAQYDITVFGGRSEGAATLPMGAAPIGPAANTAPPPPNAAAIEATLRQAVGPNLRVLSNAGGLILSGTVATAAEAQRAIAIARGFAGEGRSILNQLEVLQAVQVNLRVRVAEISRQVTRELGFNWQALGNIGNVALGLQTGGTAASVLSAISGAGAGGGLGGTPGRLGFAYRSSRLDINGVIDALAADQLITVLAEPNLTAQSGETASFLAGGEFPVPVAANLTGQVTIEFKQFGVSLAFVPTVLAQDRLNLRVRPEVSELSDNGAINLPLSGGSLRIPALTVRRAETTVELGSGQSFAIAGLLQRNSAQVGQGWAGLGEVPVLGALFRSTRFQQGETELVIIITPYLVRPAANPQALVAPTDGFRPATDLDRILRQRQIAAGRTPTPLPAVDAGFILD